MRVPWRRRRNLAERLRPYVRSLPPSEPMVSAEPIRMFLYRWMIETGDPVEVIAKGFDLEVVMVAEILGGRITRLRAADIANLKRQLSLDSSDLPCAGPNF